MTYKIINNRKYYYEIEGDGPPLLLIAGYTADITLWTPIRKQLATQFRVLLFDNCGVGKSDCPEEDLSLEDRAEDALVLAESLGFKMPNVLGHSMGGAMAQILAWRHPERINKVIFAQTFLKIPPASAYMMQTVLRLQEEGLSDRRRAEVVMPWLFSDDFLTNPKKIETFLAAYEKTPNPPTLKGLQRQLRALLQFDSSSWYARITKPALVLAGSEDRLCHLKEARLLSEKIPGALLHIFHGVGHIALAEQPEEFCRVVTHYVL